MVQGTTSDAGKSALVAGLGRAFYRRGIQVVPFKPQNMALNSAVTPQGGEIGRAQALQAQACGLAPHTDMNPILIKPNTDITAQIIVHGVAQTDMDAAVYHDYKKQALNAVLESYDRLAQQYETILVEGAGSPAEINLRENDIANMGFAEQVDCPVILVADIDRGGVFAHIVGTLELLSPSEQERVKGFVINKFRGDITLLQSGLDWLEQKTEKPVLGVLPYLHDLYLDAEDSINQNINQQKGSDRCQIVVPVLPRISNHTDFDPLRLHPDIDLHYIRVDEPLPAADILILPGTKNVRNDLETLYGYGWQEKLQRHLRYGGKCLGICGGYQMLGNVIHDHEGIEGKAGSTHGFAVFDMQTKLEKQKTLTNVKGHMQINGSAVEISGYEIHAGISTGMALAKPLIQLDSTVDGAISEDGQVIGTYLHGLFESPAAINEVIKWAGYHSEHEWSFNKQREQAIDKMADAIEQYIDLDLLMHL